MELDGMEKYRLLMEGVKLRIDLIDKGMTGKFGMPDVPLLESCALQLRKALEAIAFGSLVANEKVYGSAHNNYEKEWNAKKLLQKLGKLNPNFYPVPVKQIQSDTPSVLLRHEKIKEGYLTKADFIDAYQECSELIHTANPFSGKAPKTLSSYSKSFFAWRQKIVNLLNLHELHLYNDPGMAVCSMNDGGTDQVRVYRFAPPATVAKK